jgi:hypothetical protein
VENQRIGNRGPLGAGDLLHEFLLDLVGLGGVRKLQAVADLYFLNKVWVTSLTRASVHCAERMVATNGSNGFEKRSAIFASGYFLYSAAMMLFASAMAPQGMSLSSWPTRVKAAIA